MLGGMVFTNPVIQNRDVDTSEWRSYVSVRKADIIKVRELLILGFKASFSKSNHYIVLEKNGYESIVFNSFSKEEFEKIFNGGKNYV